jgi:hypothetical protein
MLFADAQRPEPLQLQAALEGLPQLRALSLSGYHLPPDPFRPLPALTSLCATQLFMGGRISLPTVRGPSRPAPPRVALAARAPRCLRRCRLQPCRAAPGRAHHPERRRRRAAGVRQAAAAAAVPARGVRLLLCLLQCLLLRPLPPLRRRCRRRCRRRQ